MNSNLRLDGWRFDDSFRFDEIIKADSSTTFTSAGLRIIRQGRASCSSADGCRGGSWNSGRESDGQSVEEERFSFVDLTGLNVNRLILSLTDGR